MKNLAPNITKIAVGVDVSKDHLDCCIYPTEKLLRIPNTTGGLKKLVRKLLSGKGVTQVVCEASGGYERLMVKTLRKRGYKVWVVDPKRIKAYKDSKGRRVKTDPIDAKMIALFAGQESCDYEQCNPSEQEEDIKALANRRSSLVAMVINEKKRLQQESNIACKKSIEQTIRYLEKQIKIIDKKRKVIIEGQGNLQKKADIMQSMRGVGATTAHDLLSFVPELGKVENKAIAAIVGVAPETRQSGKYNGHAFIRGGRSAARKALYMAALTASRSNPVLSQFYNRLTSRGKPSKVALVGVMRKMIVTLNVMLREEKTWINYA